MRVCLKLTLYESSPRPGYAPVVSVEQYAFKGKIGGSWPQKLKAEIKNEKIKVFNILLKRSSSLHIPVTTHARIAHHATLLCAYDPWVVWLHNTVIREGRRSWGHEVHQDIHLAVRFLPFITRLIFHCKDKINHSV